jgi:hypothetical protein
LLREMRGLDLTTMAQPVAWQKVSAEVASLGPGESLRVIRDVNTAGHHKAGAIGKPFGLSATFVGQKARELGIFERDGWGMKRRFDPNDGGDGFEHWLYNDKAKAFLVPHLEAERDRRKAEADAKAAKKSGRQRGLPLGVAR